MTTLYWIKMSVLLRPTCELWLLPCLALGVKTQQGHQCKRPIAPAGIDVPGLARTGPVQHDLRPDPQLFDLPARATRWQKGALSCQDRPRPKPRAQKHRFDADPDWQSAVGVMASARIRKLKECNHPQFFQARRPGLLALSPRCRKEFSGNKPTVKKCNSGSGLKPQLFHPVICEESPKRTTATAWTARRHKALTKLTNTTEIYYKPVFCSS